MHIIFVTDFVCPYCIVAKEALRRAAEQLQLTYSMEMIPFELTPESAPPVDTYNDPVRRERFKVLNGPCREMGLDAKFPPHVVPRPYTRLAFEGWHFAEARGCGERFADLAYAAYFIREQDIGDIRVLTGLAEECGLDAAAFRAALETGTCTLTQQRANEYSHQVLQVKHVPTIFVDGREISPEEYTVEEMIRLLTEPRAAGFESSGMSFGCGPDGCG